MSRSLSIGMVLCMALLGIRPVRALAGGPYQDRAQPLVGAIPSEYRWSSSATQEPKRLVAATLAVTLGAFGAHRLYLGTDAKVPVVYGLTFGGFGVLVLIDLAHILFTKDLQAYQANNQVFMWATGSPQRLTPP
ncbi:MAG: TM2 domain-containing protein [Flavobacteriales bacterium]|nr:TM2 domain-containing protein [Flavobacteriales bacterium]